MASIAPIIIGCIDYLAYGTIFTPAMFRLKIKWAPENDREGTRWWRWRWQCYRSQEIICYIFFVAQQSSDHLWRFVAFCGVLQRLRCIRHFAAFSSVFRRVGNKFPLLDQIFGGAQTPTPFSGRLKIIVPKCGGSGPLPPLKTCFLFFSWPQSLILQQSWTA